MPCCYSVLALYTFVLPYTSVRSSLGLKFIINRCFHWADFKFATCCCGSHASGVAAWPRKGVGSVLHYNNCGVAVTAVAEQRKMGRNPSVSAQYAAPSSSYPRRNPSCKSERAEEVIEGANGLQTKPQHITQKVAAAALGGPGGNWYWFWKCWICVLQLLCVSISGFLAYTERRSIIWIE